VDDADERRCVFLENGRSGDQGLLVARGKVFVRGALL
jgi:hypothetical protein